MLSNLIITRQKFVLIKDELGQEKISQKFITQMLKEQGEDVTIKTLAIGEQLNDEATLQKFLNECRLQPQEEGKSWNVILPNLSDFLAYQKVSVIFQFLNNLKNCEHVKRTFLWISLPHLHHDHAQYVVAAFEYMADLVLHLLTGNELSYLMCKPGGGVTFKHYTYSRTKTEFKVELKSEVDKSKASSAESPDGQKAEQLGTFKIELDEDEMVARNAMKMPYEKAMEATESNIIYTPDDADDFDDEDPDEDLNI
ncbi:elongator complex protein 5 [Lucilia cuprina]|uniref:elongator complex protein 5 n=1 Tax=Lucilia cuprina TaxID=7375 RepID=UPI001F0707E5|nr:elongator complex protein 5 [Lucilia cuprina]